MPQLDIFSYSEQYVGLLLIFTIFYLYGSLEAIPAIARRLKLRQRMQGAYFGEQGKPSPKRITLKVADVERRGRRVEFYHLMRQAERKEFCKRYFIGAVESRDRK